MTREDVLEELGYSKTEELPPGVSLMLDTIVFADGDSEKALEPYGADVVKGFVDECVVALLEDPFAMRAVIRGAIAGGIILERSLQENQQYVVVDSSFDREIVSGDSGVGLA